ncbi:MAG: creatininase family protein [Anaerolineae bacterium]|nr:creatininase family protein [Anaerolineae bacterium]
MRLEDLNWMDVEHYLETDDRIILISGATEQHAYLSLLTDILIPSRLALAVAEREKVLIAPPLNFGFSKIFTEYPGTISLTRNTFELVMLEIFEGLLHQGFRGFFFMNGHGGNQLPARLHDFMEDSEIRITWYDWWRSPAVRNFEARHDLVLNHANWGENFPFNRVAECPIDEKPVVDTTELTTVYSARAVLGDGNFGGLYQVRDELMHELFAMVADEATALVRAMRRP